MQKLTFKVTDRLDLMTVNVNRSPAEPHEHWQVEIAGKRAEVDLDNARDGSGWLRYDGRVMPFHCVRTDSRVEVWLGGKIYSLEAHTGSGRRQPAHAAAVAVNELTAPMPGTILKVNASAGDAFDANSPLIIMESMKMEVTLSSPAPGRIKELRCKVGELVELGRVLAVLEAADSNG